jgi:hypothetical protein
MISKAIYELVEKKFKIEDSQIGYLIMTIYYYEVKSIEKKLSCCF